MLLCKKHCRIIPEVLSHRKSSPKFVLSRTTDVTWDKMRVTKANKEMEERIIKYKWHNALDAQPEFKDQAKDWSAHLYGRKAINRDDKKTKVLTAAFYRKLSMCFSWHFTSAMHLENHSSPSNQNVLLAHLSIAVTSQTCWIWNWF